MSTYTVLPQLTFADGYAQPSDKLNGRKIIVNFDSSNIATDADGYYTSSVILGVCSSNPTVAQESFNFIYTGQSLTSTSHFTSLSNIIINATKINTNDYYGVVNIKELLPLSQTDNDGYTNKVLAFGSGIFVIDGYGSYDSYGAFSGREGYGDPGTGTYQFDYLSPLHIPLNSIKNDLTIGNNLLLNNSFDGVLDEIKLTSATAIKSRNRVLSGSYDISAEAKSPISQVPDAKTSVLLHCDDNTASIVDAIRDPLDMANLTDTQLETIVNLRNNKTLFIDFVNSLQITGDIIEGSGSTLSLAEQLYLLVSSLNNLSNSANYYRIAGSFFPSEINVNNNFNSSASFVGETYSINKAGLINNKNGSIELWLAPMFNVFGDLKTRVYFDIFSHNVIGDDGSLTALSPRIIKLPFNIKAQKILSVKLYNTKVANFEFSQNCQLSSNGNVIVLDQSLPADNSQIIIDYIPVGVSNDRITLFKNGGGQLVFAMTAGKTTYTLSRDISSWQKDSWHRVLLTWTTNTKNSLDSIHMFVDGNETTTIKYGEGFLYGTFIFGQENLTTTTSKIIAQNIPLSDAFDVINVGTDYAGSSPAMARLSNLRISYITRQPIIDIRGSIKDADYAGGAASASPVVADPFTTLLEDFTPDAQYITKFASIPGQNTGQYDATIEVRDEFNLIKGVDNGLIEKMVKKLIKLAAPAHIRAKIVITR